MFPGIDVDQLMDAAYKYGAGLDMCWDCLWSYRSVHADSVIRWGQHILYQTVGKDKFHGAMIGEKETTMLTALWVIAHLPLPISY